MEIENVKLDVDVLDTTIGTEKPSLEPKKVIVVGAKTDKVKSSVKDFGDKLVLICKHPDAEEPINLSSIRYLEKNIIKHSGLWLKKDSDGKLPSRSAIAFLLRFVNKPTINSMIGLELDTLVDETGYLVIKAF